LEGDSPLALEKLSIMDYLRQSGKLDLYQGMEKQRGLYSDEYSNSLLSSCFLKGYPA